MLKEAVMAYLKVLSWSVYEESENLNQDNQCHCQNTSQKHEPTCLVRFIHYNFYFMCRSYLFSQNWIVIEKLIHCKK
jgi:hypothetical protein